MFSDDAESNMQKKITKHTITGILLLAAPSLIVFLLLVIFNQLYLGTALLAWGCILFISAIFGWRLFYRLKRIENHLQKMSEGQQETLEDTLIDPGAGIIGDLAAAVQRLDRSWRLERKTLSDSLTATSILFDAIPDPLITLDKQSRLVYANSSARNLLAENRSETDVKGRDLSSVLRQPSVLGAVEDVLNKNKAIAIEFSLADRIEQTFEARIESISGTNFSENDSAIIVLLRDITAQKNSEQSRADFVANVSHELRTPLTSLIGFIETLRGSAKDDPEARIRFLNLMANQSDRMARLVEDLLSLSRIEMNEHNPPDQTVNLVEVIDSILSSLAPQAQKREISFEVKLTNIDRLISGDLDEITQLFQNLIENSIKYSREKSIISILARNNVQADSVSISITDKGEGIAREHLARLTERFYRIDTARSRELGGTGLGLAIVKHIVNRHRGKLEIHSQEGEGSKFTVTLDYAFSPDLSKTL